MPCSCYDPCACSVEAGALITITGSGDVTDPWTISAQETSFNPTGTNGIAITPSGPGDFGHSPTFEIEVDPSSTAPVSVSPNGLKVDCCDGGSSLASVTDTDTVDLTLNAGDLQADVIVSGDACNDLQALASGLYVPARGERWIQAGEDGLTNGITVNIASSGNPSGISWEHCFTNSGDCDIILTVFGQATMNATIVSSAANVNLDVAARIERIAGSVATFLGGNTISSVRFIEMTNTGSLNPFSGGEGITCSDMLSASMRIPPSGNIQLRSYMQSTNFTNLNGAAASGNGFTFGNVHIRITREDSSIPITIAAGAC